MNILALSNLLAFMLWTLFNFMMMKTSLKMKNIPFECGFNLMMKNYPTFSNQFFMISIMFLIFDLEIILILPFLINPNSINMMSNLMILFFLILTFLYLMEWKNNFIFWAN